MLARVVLVILLVVVLLTAAGCGGAREIDDTAYVLLVGVDQIENDKLEFSFQIAVPRSFANGNSPKDMSEATDLLTVKAESLVEARDLANSSMARILSFSHVKGFVLGEAVAQYGIDRALPELNRFREYRGSMFLMVIKDGTAQDFIRDTNPKLEISPARYIETMMASAVESSGYLGSSIHQYYVRLKNSSGDPYVTLVGTNQGVNQYQHSKNRSDKTGTYLAGEVPRGKASNPSEFVGVAIFSGDRMVGYLNNKETRSLAIIEGKFKRGFVSVADPLQAGKSVDIEIQQVRKPEIQAKLLDGRAVFIIDVSLNGEITAVDSGIRYESEPYQPALEQQVAAVIAKDITDMIATTQRLGSDAGGLSCRLWPQFKTYHDIQQVDWPSLYRQADIQVNIDIKIRRSGFMIETSPTRMIPRRMQ